MKCKQQINLFIAIQNVVAKENMGGSSWTLEVKPWIENFVKTIILTHFILT
jgi:hypothetical protein